MLQCVELFLVVRIADDDVSSDFVEFTKVIDLRNDILQGKIFRRRSLRSLILCIFVLLFGLFRSCLAFLYFRRLCISTLFGFLNAPSNRLLLQIDTDLIENNRKDIFGVEQAAF